MIVLSVSGPLKAQSTRNLLTVSEERSAGVELRDDFAVRPSEIGFTFDGYETFTESAVPANAFSIFTIQPFASTTPCADWFSHPALSHEPGYPQPSLREECGRPGENSKSPSVEGMRPPKPPDFNQNIYYKNKLEFGLDVGWLPINIPFVFDVFLGDGYTMTPLRYTLVPIIASVRWQMGEVAGPSFLRGNWDLSASASAVVIPRGPETRYYAWIMGIRRNFVQRNWKIAPYFDGRLGLGNIDAKEPLGVIWSQGQNFTFTVNLGSGVRYNFNPRYSISAGLNWMHISNLYLSEPRFPNYGINVYGPMFGIDVRIGKPHHHASE
jgi:hypothetical protein